MSLGSRLEHFRLRRVADLERRHFDADRHRVCVSGADCCFAPNDHFSHLIRFGERIAPAARIHERVVGTARGAGDEPRLVVCRA